MKKKVISLLLSIIILFASCASVQHKNLAPDTLFDIVNIKDNKRPKKDKEIWKVLVFSTITFMIYTSIEYNNLQYKPNGWNGR